MVRYRPKLRQSLHAEWISGVFGSDGSPALVSRIIYGATPTEVVGIALVRHWGLLVFLVGVLLIYAAFHPALREPVTVVAAVEKTAFSLGIFGTSLRRHPIAAGIAVGDILIPLVYVLYLVGF